MAGDLYRWLVDGARGDPADGHVLACMLAHAWSDTEPSLALTLGLAPAELAAMMDEVFPHAAFLVAGLPGDGQGPQAIEEPDLRALLIEHGTRGAPIERWLAHILARRSLGANHLWQDLGLAGRGDLSGLLKRHFAPLAVRNDRDMKWKKFFYRELCEREGVSICKAPSCEICTDFSLCFGAEDGEPLARLAWSPIRQGPSRKELPPCVN